MKSRRAISQHSKREQRGEYPSVRTRSVPLCSVTNEVEVPVCILAFSCSRSSSNTVCSSNSKGLDRFEWSCDMSTHLAYFEGLSLTILQLRSMSEQGPNASTSNSNSSSNAMDGEYASSSGRSTLVNTEHTGPALAANGVVRDGLQTMNSSPHLSNLDAAKVTSPTVERSNPLSMRVTARNSGSSSSSSSRPALKRKAGTNSSAIGTSTAMHVSTSKSGSDKGKNAATSSESDEDGALEPKEAIRQQFYVC